MKCSKEYIEREYAQASREYKFASDIHMRQSAISRMAAAERLAMQLYGYSYADGIHAMYAPRIDA